VWELLVVRLEHDPLETVVDGVLDEGGETPDADVLPLRVVGAHRGRTMPHLLDEHRGLEPL
jgi:hypothetical protein